MRDNRNIWPSIFWGISQVVLATFPAFAKEILAETNTVVIQELLACSGAGIAIGSLVAGRYRIEVLGFNNLPGQGGVLMLGDHISWLD